MYANFLRNEIVYLVDGSFVDSARFDNTRALAKEGIEDIEFSQFIDDAEAAYKAYQERYKPKPVENARWLPGILSIWKTTTPLRWRRLASLMCICAMRVSR